jgi:hypothetical protein
MARSSADSPVRSSPSKRAEPVHTPTGSSISASCFPMARATPPSLAGAFGERASFMGSSRVVYHWRAEPELEYPPLPGRRRPQDRDDVILHHAEVEFDLTEGPKGP